MVKILQDPLLRYHLALVVGRWWSLTWNGHRWWGQFLWKISSLGVWPRVVHLQVTWSGSAGRFRIKWIAVQLAILQGVIFNAVVLLLVSPRPSPGSLAWILHHGGWTVLFARIDVVYGHFEGRVKSTFDRGFCVLSVRRRRDAFSFRLDPLNGHPSRFWERNWYNLDAVRTLRWVCPNKKVELKVTMSRGDA